MATTTTEERQVEPFHAISLEGVGTVDFVQDQARFFRIEGDPDALRLISIRVVDGTLQINTKPISVKFISLKRPPVYTVTAPDLDRIEVRGAGRANIGRLETDRLSITVDGAGDVKLQNQALGTCRIRISGAGTVKASGTARAQEIDIAGAGNFAGEQLVGESATVRIAGAGRAKVNVSGDLSVDIGGVGSVTYLGDPRVQSKIQGLGRVKRA